MVAPSYEVLAAASGRDLAEDEYWVIDHDEGPLWDTRSKRFDVPVLIFCRALDCSWEDGQENGFRLNKLVMPKRTAYRRQS